jgi:alginate O-acetyltransferase complex protein AlgI
MASALWHGVTLNFLIWGCLHAFVFGASVYALKRGSKFFPLIILPVSIVLGRLIFADTDTDRLFEKLRFSFSGFEVFTLIISARNTTKVSLALGLILLLIEFLFQNHRLVSKRNYKFLRTPLALVTICLVFILFVSTGGVDFAVYGQR